MIFIPVSQIFYCFLYAFLVEKS